MALTDNTGVKFQIIETNDASHLPFVKGQFIIQDDGSVFYDPTIGDDSNNGSNKEDRLKLIKENKLTSFNLEYGKNNKNIQIYLDNVKNPKDGDKIFFDYYNSSNEQYETTGRQFTENGWEVCQTNSTEPHINLDNKEVYLNIIKDSASNNDFCCIFSLINGTNDKYENALHIFYENEWHILNNVYNAKNVYFDENIKATIKIGDIEPVNGITTLETKGKSLFETMNMILSSEKLPTNNVKPKITIRLFNGAREITSDTSLEIGTIITPRIKVSVDKGSYEFGPNDTGVKFKDVTISLSGQTRSVDSIKDNNPYEASFDQITLGTNVLQAFITMTQTKGNPANKLPSGVIESMFTEKIYDSANPLKSYKISSYVRGFYFGYSNLVLNKEDITSDLIRSLYSHGYAYKSNEKRSFDVEPGAKTIILAVPSEKPDISSILNTTVNAEMKDAFILLDTFIPVAGASGRPTDVYAHQYKVWLYSPVEPYKNKTNFIVTLG